MHERLVEASHGHPLALSLLADVVVRGGEATVDPLAPDLVGTLVRRFVDVVPVGLRRGALEVCALARVTTEPLLRDALALDDAHELFAWLRDLSFVESGPDGLFPHELARDVLDADLRWRDPGGYKDLFRRVRRHTYAALKASRAREQQRAAFDLKFMFRNLPSVLSPVDWDAWGLSLPRARGPRGRRERARAGGGGGGRRVGGHRRALARPAAGGLLRRPRRARRRPRGPRAARPDGRHRAGPPRRSGGRRRRGSTPTAALRHGRARRSRRRGSSSTATPTRARRRP